jgi:hypothetical protein
MNANFATFYNELLQLAQKHADNGTPLQEIYGACVAAQNYIDALLQEHYKRQLRNSENQVQRNDTADDPPLVETTEDN